MTSYKTPSAVRSDARTLAGKARALRNATVEMAEEEVAEARHRLAEVMNYGKESYASLQKKSKAADKTIRSHPYQSIAVAFGVGTLLGFLASRRD